MADDMVFVGPGHGFSFAEHALYTAGIFIIGYFFGKAVAHCECEDAENNSPRRRHQHNILGCTRSNLPLGMLAGYSKADRMLM